MKTVWGCFAQCIIDKDQILDNNKISKFENPEVAEDGVTICSEIGK